VDRTRTDGEAATIRQLDKEDRSGRPDTDAERDLRVKEAQAALLARYAPETRVRRVGWSQGETQVLELGAGPPILLVHGGGDSAFEWVPILPALARNHRVLAVDRPGHGLADPFDYAGVDLLDHARTFLRDILDALELRAVDIVANSIGGLWSVAFALDAPDRVSRLALVGAPPGVSRGAPLQLRLFGLPLVGRRLGRLLLSNPTRDRWQAVKVPTLFLWGERDAFMTPRVKEAWEVIAARNTNISITPVSDAGHLPWIDDPERVVDEIERFLASDLQLAGRDEHLTLSKARASETEKEQR
jgi:pimeloyl-ACP methyl ester carboxylesterase